jgi:hypothetical protein
MVSRFCDGSNCRCLRWATSSPGHSRCKGTTAATPSGGRGRMSGYQSHQKRVPECADTEHALRQRGTTKNGQSLRAMTVFLRRKRRATVPHLQYQYGQSVRVPLGGSKYVGELTSHGSSHNDETSLPRRYHQRSRKLTTSDEAAIRSLASTRSLRALAFQFGVSHETIRILLRGSR